MHYLLVGEPSQQQPPETTLQAAASSNDICSSQSPKQPSLSPPAETTDTAPPCNYNSLI